MTKYEKGPDRGPSRIIRKWPVLPPTLWLVLSPILTGFERVGTYNQTTGRDGRPIQADFLFRRATVC